MSTARIGLVGCAKSKEGYSTRASEMYSSPLFRKSKKYADDHYDRWYILSAKYYLLDPDRRIEPYERTLTRMSAQEKMGWSRVVLKSIMEKHPDPDRVKLFVHAGAEYRRYLLPLLEENGYTCDVPLEGLRIGEQIRWYNSHGTCVR